MAKATIEMKEHNWQLWQLGEDSCFTSSNCQLSVNNDRLNYSKLYTETMRHVKYRIFEFTNQLKLRKSGNKFNLANDFTGRRTTRASLDKAGEFN